MNDPVLEQLENRALAASPALNIIRARLRQVRAAFRLERARRSPAAGAQAVVAHAELADLKIGAERTAGGATGSPGNGAVELGSENFYNAGFDARWELDIFGGRRRAREAAAAQVGATEANLADAQVQLTAEVAMAYINLRERQKQLLSLEIEAEIERQLMGLVKQRVERGVATLLDAERLQVRIESSQQQSTQVEIELESFRNELTALAGEQPGAFDQLLTPSAPLPAIPDKVNIGDVEMLLRRRPDIRSAERQLASRTASIGVAEASRFPHLSLFGLIGLGGNSLDHIADPGNLNALAIPKLQWQFHDFGRGAARVEQARGQRDEAEAEYRQTVAMALRDASNAVARFGYRRQSLASLARVNASIARTAGLVLQRHQGGTVTLIEALEARLEQISSERDLITAAGALAGEYVALHKALGLGWTPT